MSRSLSTPTIEIQKVRGNGADLPVFLSIAQRHFEKAIPTVGSGRATLTIPTDLLNVLLPGPLLDTIESIEVTYARAG
jgi:hypothetical protein